MAEEGVLSLESVKKKALGRYISLLKSWLKSEDSFPLRLRGCSINSSVPFGQRIQLIKELSKQQKTESSPGYLMILETRNTRSEGTQSFLKSIEFPTLQDYLSYLDKSTEFSLFQNCVNQIRHELPELEEWLWDNPKKILKYIEEWDELIQVVLYFRDKNPSKVSLRNLPIPVHTKFIETHQPILIELLDRVIPEERINQEESDLALRYGLNKDEDFRFRIVIPDALSIHLPFRDIAVLPSEMEKWNPEVPNILVIENKHSFLGISLPTDWIKIWGNGNGVIRLKNCRWLEEKNLFYWGDLDPQGFEILHLLRSAFPHTRSVCMGIEDYNQFSKYAHSAANYNVRNDLILTPEEQNCYSHLTENHQFSRIEQERIDLEWLSRQLSLC